MPERLRAAHEHTQPMRSLRFLILRIQKLLNSRMVRSLPIGRLLTADLEKALGMADIAMDFEKAWVVCGKPAA